MIQSTQCPLQPQPIPTVQNTDDIVLMTLYEATCNIVRGQIESRSHGSHLHHGRSPVILVAA
jgi:hypothetical protein